MVYNWTFPPLASSGFIVQAIATMDFLRGLTLTKQKKKKMKKKTTKQKEEEEEEEEEECTSQTAGILFFSNTNRCATVLKMYYCTLDWQRTAGMSGSESRAYMHDSFVAVHVRADYAAHTPI